MNKYTWKPVADEITLRELYVTQRLSLAKIAVLLHASPKAVSTTLNKFGIPLYKATPRHTSGENCYAWKGGRAISSQGYVLVRSEGHPRSTKRGKYVFEHILVVEKMLGRFLIDGEVVHHLNGNKQDNRVENLEITSPADHIEHHRDNKNGRIKKCG